VVLNYQENGDTPFYSDLMRINAILKNTIGNAVKYRKKDISNPEVFMTIDVNLERLHLIIKDNGEGIPENSLPKVFDMFYRASKSSNGTGLGLYICKEIINKLGGEISIESQLGIGTTVSIMLPNLIENRNNE
jgi:signal transduction histidine kinase